MPDTTEAHEVKLLSDILALVLAEEAGQADAALQALRRRARQSRISGGAIKDVFLRVSRDARPDPADLPEDVRDWATARLLIADLRRNLRSQGRDLAAERDNARALEASLYETRRRFTEVQEENVRALASRRIWAGSAFAFGALGVALVALALPTLHRARPAAPPGAHATAAASPPPVQTAITPVTPAPPGQASGAGSGAPGLTAEQRTRVGDFVRSCFLTSSNAIYAGRFQVNVLVQTDETGTIRSARISDQDMARMGDPSFRGFAELAVRSLLEPRCATLPLPEDMLGAKHAFVIRFGA